MIRGRFLTSRDDISQVIALRREVFCEEQGYSVDTEPDAHDDMAVYALAFDDEGRPLGTGRLYIADDQFRIGRVCVKKEMRGMHIGDFVMRMLLYRAQQLHAGSVTLSAQADKLDFYRRYGFQPYEELVYDEGQPHRMMRVEGDKINLEGTCGGHGKPCQGCEGNCENCAQA